MSTNLFESAPSDPSPKRDLPSSAPADSSLAGARPHAQWIAVFCIIGSFLAFWFAGELLNIPVHRGLKGSILGQPGATPAIGLLVAAIVLSGVSFLTSKLVGTGWQMAGPLAATAGLCAWSFRAGPIRYELITTDLANLSAGVFVRLSLETLVLGLIAGLGWFIVYPRWQPAAGEHDRPVRLGFNVDTIQPILTQALLFAVLVLVLVPTQDKKQAVFGVLLASLAATGVAHHLNRETSPVRLYWIGPVLVGMVGYLVVWKSAAAPVAMETGSLNGLLAGLARPLPLDYAGAGGVGVILGLWIAAVEPHSENDKPVQSDEDRAGHGTGHLPRPEL